MTQRFGFITSNAKRVALRGALLVIVHILFFLFIFTHEVSLAASIYSTLILLSLNAIVFLLMALSQRHYHSRMPFSTPNSASIVLFSALTATVFYHSAKWLFYTEKSGLALLYDSIWVLTFILLLNNSLILLSFWGDQQTLREEKIRAFAIEKERIANQVELKSIQEQFKPHFLFNSLNSISALCLSNPEEAREMIVLLSDYLRKTVNVSKNELVTLKEEIDYIQKYTAIERIRFGNRLIVDYTFSPDEEIALLPSLSLQPIIENAIKYGLYGTIGEVKITLTAHTEDAHLIIRVSNPFDAESQAASRGTGYGLASIEKKLHLIYGRSYLVSKSVDGDQFTITLKIPQL